MADSVAVETPRSRWAVYRRSDDRVVAGLASGVAARLGIDPVYVRAAFIVLAVDFGIGLLLYLAGWAATSDRVDGEVPPAEEAGRRQLIGLGVVFLGFLLLVRSTGFWPGDGLMWPITAVVFGLAFLWEQREVDSRLALRRLFEPGEKGGRWRLLLGAGLLVFGLSMLGTTAVPELGGVILAVLVTGIGLLLVLGPWLYRLAEELGAERRERIRQEERAEMAAHLHDSVLQTLALIQRTDDPKRMTTLARSQERELRRWLYDRAPHDDTLLSTALRAVADRVEADHDLPVEIVNVGDCPVDDRTLPLVHAAGEAMTNAAKHSGADLVSLYVEVTDGAIDLWVADQGKGFEPASVPEDRRGISDSIVGRMERHGGGATIVAETGEGTEVHLHLPRIPA